jgi:hypothetical protein
MYLELRIVADYGQKAAFVTKLKAEIGINAVPHSVAIAQTSLQPYASIILPKIVAAEQIQHKAYILYFFEGSDTIVAHITGKSVAEVKEQAKRISRRLPKLFETLEVETKSSGVIYSVNPLGFDTPVLKGEKMTFWMRFIDAFTERWMTRLLTPAIVFWIAAAFLPGTNFFQSAAIGMLAVLVSVIIEGIVFAKNAGEWKWDEV